MTVERELREALAALRRAREALPQAAEIMVRAAIAHELAAAEASTGRVLHLIAGAPAKEQTPCSG